MKFKISIFILLIFESSNAFSGAREDFQEAVKAAGCEIPATPGRSGTIMQWRTCTSDSIKIEGCTLQCVDESSQIGG